MKILGVLIGFLFCSFSTVAGLTPLTLALDWSINPNHAPILIAEQKGYFASEGLSVRLLTPTETEEPLRLVLSGHADMAVSYPTDLIFAQAKGLPMVQVGALFNRSVNCLTVLKSSGISTLKQLEGKKIGLSGGATGSAMLKIMLQRAGVDLSKVQFVTVQMGLAGALISHQVSGVWGFSSNDEPILLARMGHPVSLFLPESEGLPSMDGYIFIAKKDVLSGATQQAFLRAIHQAVVFIKAHPTKAWQILIKAYPEALAPDLKSEQANHQVFLATLPFYAVNPGQVDPAQLETLRKFMEDQGILNN